MSSECHWIWMKEQFNLSMYIGKADCSLCLHPLIKETLKELCSLLSFQVLHNCSLLAPLPVALFSFFLLPLPSSFARCEGPSKPQLRTKRSWVETRQLSVGLCWLKTVCGVKGLTCGVALLWIKDKRHVYILVLGAGTHSVNEMQMTCPLKSI